MDDLVAFLTARLDEDERELVKDPPVGLGYANLPARIRREVAAKRAILRRCTAHMNELDEWPNGLVSSRALLARQILMDLAAAWSDHPDHDPEWQF